MDAQKFLAEFGHIADAPGGVSRLRGLVLQLAVSGRLSEREIEDTPASVLISANQQTQQQLVHEKRMKRLPAPSKISTKNTPWPLPEGWEWTRLGSVTNYGNAPKIEYSDVAPETWVLELEDIEKGTSNLLKRVIADKRKFKSTKNGFPEGSILYGKLRPYLDKVLIADRNGVCTTEIAPISFFHGIEVAYLRWYLKCPYFINYASNSTHGMNLPRLGTDAAREALFPFPPKKQQSRIVAKVNELMALCDRLETQQQQRRNLQNNLRQATLQAVATATSPHELQTSWGRLAANIDQLFDTQNDVEDLRNLIQDMAMRGLFTGGTLSAPSDGDPQKQLPPGWKWETLGDLSEYITSGSRGWKEYLSSSGDTFIRSQDIKHDALIFENRAFVALPDKTEGKRTRVCEGDLLLTITGGNVGKCARVPELECAAYVSQHVALIRLKDKTLAEFIHFWMTNSYGGRSFLSRYIYGDKPGLNLTQVASVPIPVPAESVRLAIVEKIRSYQAICERLSKQMDNKRVLADVFAAAAASSFTGITATENEDPPLTAPQTELIAPVRLGQTPNVKAQAPLATILVRHNGELAAKDLWQRFGGEIDAFYAQLKTEVAHGWILEPGVAEMRTKEPA